MANLSINHSESLQEFSLNHLLWLMLWLTSKILKPSLTQLRIILIFLTLGEIILWSSCPQFSQRVRWKIPFWACFHHCKLQVTNHNNLLWSTPLHINGLETWSLWTTGKISGLMKALQYLLNATSKLSFGILTLLQLRLSLEIAQCTLLWLILDWLIPIQAFTQCLKVTIRTTRFQLFLLKRVSNYCNGSKIMCLVISIWKTSWLTILAWTLLKASIPLPWEKVWRCLFNNCTQIEHKWTPLFSKLITRSGSTT